VHRIAAKRPSAPSRQTSPNRFHVMSHFEAIKQIRKSYAPWLPRDHAMFKRGDNGCRLCSIVFGHVSLPSYCCAPLRAAFGTPYDRDKESERAVERSRALIALAARSAAAVTKKTRQDASFVSPANDVLTERTAGLPATRAAIMKIVCHTSCISAGKMNQG
jgi:hypothetical protein